MLYRRVLVRGRCGTIAWASFLGHRQSYHPPAHNHVLRRFSRVDPNWVSKMSQRNNRIRENALQLRELSAWVVGLLFTKSSNPRETNWACTGGSVSLRH
ncbi:hypothetical protein RSAG8_08341, partial [Rhizoctonia solani AG-8 WAC10335]